MNNTYRLARVNPKNILILAFFIFILAYAFPIMESHWERNNLALRITHSLIGGETMFQSTAYMGLSSLDSDPCWKSWFLGITFDALGDLEQRDLARAAALRCSPSYLSLLQVTAADDHRLAELAVQLYPEIPQAWFWLAKINQKDNPLKAVDAFWRGLQQKPHDSNAWVQLGRTLAALEPQVALNAYETLALEQMAAGDPLVAAEVQFVLAAAISKTQPERAVQLYHQGLKIKPLDDIRWYQLGYLLEEIDPQSALDAFLRSCDLGDHGSHGCYEAGQMAEELGDIAAAIEYYQLSRLQQSLDRADQLQGNLP